MNNLRVVAWKTTNQWRAQCLEEYVYADAPKLRDSILKLIEVLPKAPRNIPSHQIVFDMFDEGVALVKQSYPFDEFKAIRIGDMVSAT